MVNFKGSHGTTKIIAEKIISDGFDVSGGRFVRGAYFWLESYHYLDLAVGWFNYYCARGSYSEDSPECAVIIVELRCKKNEHLDLERPDLKDRLARLCDQKHANCKDDKEVHTLYTYIIREMERIGGVKFKLFSMKVQPPKETYCPRYQSRLLGFPTCVVAVSNGNIIKKEIYRGKL